LGFYEFFMIDSICISPLIEPAHASVSRRVRRFLAAGLQYAIWMLVMVLCVARCCEAVEWSLLECLDVALSRSDKAMEFQEDLQLSTMDVAAAEHQFDTKLVPLASIGVTQGTGTQQLGLEMRRDMSTGTAVAYGVVGRSLNDDSGYVVENEASARAYVRLSQGLLRRWGSDYNLSELTSAELRLRAREITTQRLQQSLILSTVQQYYDLLLARQLRLKADLALKRSQDHLDAAKARQAVGLVSKVDVYRAELAMLNAESQIQQLDRRQQRAETAFRQFLRLPEEEAVGLQGGLLRMIPVIPDNWEKELLGSRLDWQAQRIAMQVAEVELAKANDDLQPDIDLNFTIEQMGEGDSASDAIELDETNWSLQLEMRSTFDQFNEKNVLMRKRIEQTRLRRATEAMKQRIVSETRAAFADLVLEDNNYQLNVRRLKQAEMAMELAETRYERGLSDNLDMLDAETALSEAENNLVSSLVAYNITATSLANSLGILDRRWIAESLKPAAPAPPAQDLK
jgi:outer membrane protein